MLGKLDRLQVAPHWPDDLHTDRQSFGIRPGGDDGGRQHRDARQTRPERLVEVRVRLAVNIDGSFAKAAMIMHECAGGHDGRDHEVKVGKEIMPGPPQLGARFIQMQPIAHAHDLRAHDSRGLCGVIGGQLGCAGDQRIKRGLLNACADGCHQQLVKNRMAVRTC